MSVLLGCIVEGHGDRQAVPILVRRIAEDMQLGLQVKLEILRTPKSKLMQPRELERAVSLVARRVGRAGGILIVLDSDDDCPGELGLQILARARSERSDLPVAAVLAKREFEAWFLAGARSLRGRRGLPADMEPVEYPESVRGAKEWLDQRMEGNRYSESLDQPALAAVLDLEEARSAGSFDKFFRDVTSLLALLTPPEVTRD